MAEHQRRKIKRPCAIKRRAFVSSERKYLLVLIHDNGASGLFFCLGLLGGHGFVDPLVGGLQIGGAGGQVIALDIGSFPVHQVHVGHGVVIIRTKLERLVQIVDTFLNVGGIVLFHLGTDLLVLGRQGVFRLHAELGALFLTRHISLRPVDDCDRIIRLGVVGIGLGSLLIKVLGHGKFLHLQVEIRDALDAVDVLGIDLQHLFVRINRLLGKTIVVGSIGARNVLLGESCGQI